jgi:hypothetical protein
MVAEGATFLEVLDHVSTRDDRTLTPVIFLKILQDELGISFVRSRDILEYFDPGMNPIADASLINERGHAILHGFSQP